MIHRHPELVGLVLGFAWLTGALLAGLKANTYDRYQNVRTSWVLVAIFCLLCAFTSVTLLPSTLNADARSWAIYVNH